MKASLKIDFASFQFFLPSYQVTQLLKSREISLELKRGDPYTLVQGEKVRFIVLPFPFSSQLKIGSFHVVVVQGRQRNVKKSVMPVQSCCFAHKIYCIFDVPVVVTVVVW